MNALSFKLEQKIITFLSPHMCDFFSSLSCLQSVLNSMAFSVRSRLYGCVYCVSLILLRLSVSCFGEVISKINIIQNFPALVQLWAIFTMRFLFERVERRAKLYCRGFDGVTRSSQLLFRSSRAGNYAIQNFPISILSFTGSHQHLAIIIILCII